jgi:TonB family protein
MKQNRAIIGTAGLILAAAAAFLPLPLGGGNACAGDEIMPPKPIQSCMVQPVYPEQEKKAGTVGTVLLSVEVKADGTVGEIRAEQEIVGHPAFTASAVAAVGKWCFEPALKDGSAVVCTVTIPVRYVLDEKKK